MTVNWAGNVRYTASEYVRPFTVEQVRKAVANAGRVRALGTRHSFNDLADSPGVLLSVADLPPIVDVDTTRATARVAAGLSYAELAPRLDAAGFALPSMASLPHISVGGAVATATHGSGVRNQVLSASVTELDLVTAGGDVVTIGRGDPDFEGVVVGLGALGVVTHVTLDLVPAYEMRQRVYGGLALEALDDHFAELMSCAYSVCLFTDWRAPALTQVWVQERVDEPAALPSWFTAEPAEGPRHPVDGMDPVSCTTQGGVAGPWFDRLPHFRSDQPPSSSGDELQSEYMIPATDAVAALHALDEVRERIRPALQICEVRTVARDGLWLSTCTGRDTVSIHFTWVSDLSVVLPVVRLVEERLAPFSPRPHWAKTSVATGEYERLPDFRALMGRYDPAGKFANAFTERHFSGPETSGRNR
ncbi:FAD-binding protein [Nocardia sp. NRRL S-836]|uniref:FAD-binding protein n=1 Tax=Nocardia sp. NRRL S-836 TaxID=1519492 RepID=UPI0006AE62B6|nr:FAD-binding protein [Nocardia sp. NRRL S-836]